MGKIFTIILLILVSSFGRLSYGQVAIPVIHQPEQDLCGAFTICSDTFFNYKSYQGVGVLWESLPGTNPFAPPTPVPGGPPSGNLEDSLRENSHWLKLTIAESGYLAFDLIPLNPADHFQILVFKANGPCTTPHTYSFVRSASNRNDLHYAPTFTHTGIKLNSSESTDNKAAPLFVNAGEVYYIRIFAASKYTAVNPLLTVAVPAKAGYILDLSKKTCRFEIGPPPMVDYILGNGCHNEDFIDIVLNRNINCNSIEINGSDFSLTPRSVTGAIGSGCSFGEGLTSKIRLYFDGKLAPGNYSLNIVEGTDGNTLLDICHQEAPTPQYMTFTVQKLRDTVSLYVCKEAMPYTWNGITFTDTGAMLGYFRTPNVNGCDSTTYLNLYTVDSFVHYETVYACDNIFPIMWYGGQSTSTYGTKVLSHVFTAQGGCDSIVYLNVLPQVVFEKDSTIVGCQAVQINEHIFTESTLYLDTVYNETGCISEVISYQIDVFAPSAVSNIYTDTGSCGYMYIGDKLIYKDTAFVDTFKTWFGCDSVYHHYNVDITPNVEPESFRYFISVCDSFNVNDVTVTSDTTMSFLFKNQYGCDSALNIYYVSIDTLDLDLISFPQVPVKGEVVRIYASSTQPNLKILSWSPSEMFPSQSSSDQSLVVNEPVTISVLAQDDRGCLAIDTLVIDQVDSLWKNESIPNAFSPNGDGLNDVFTIKFPNELGRIIKSVHIYDRYGALVYSDYGAKSFQWNGRYGNTGKAADVGVYYFQIILEYIDGEEKVITGDVTLLK